MRAGSPLEFPFAIHSCLLSDASAWRLILKLAQGAPSKPVRNAALRELKRRLASLRKAEAP